MQMKYCIVLGFILMPRGSDYQNPPSRDSINPPDQYCERRLPMEGRPFGIFVRQTERRGAFKDTMRCTKKQALPVPADAGRRFDD